MAHKSNNSALALTIQSVQGTFNTPAQPADLMPISNLRPQIQGITIANDEYTGSIVKNADSVAGKRMTLSFNVKLRGPAGADVPAANAYLLGRLLQAAKMTELRTTTAIPAAPESVSLGSVNGSTLGAGAAATANLYKGLAIQLKQLGATIKAQTTAIRTYSAAKAMTLAELLGVTLTGNYQIPKQLSYVRSVDSSDPPYLSVQAWFGGERYDLVDCRVTGLRFVIPVSTKDQAAYPELEVTLDANISATAVQAAPSVPALGGVALFKDGDQWLADKAVGGSNFTIDFGITAESPPNPNKTDGSDPAEITASTATVAMTRQKYAKDVFDTMAMADGQSNYAFFAQWGSTPGLIVQIVVPDCRFDYQNPDMGGAFVMESGNLLIDALDRGVCINFPYGVVIP